MFQHAFEFRAFILVCCSQQTLDLQGRIPKPHIWAIAKIIA
jgi:hypothetical protein